MDSGHAAVFAAISVLNIPISGWTCQVIDGVKNQNKWDTITAYKGTDPTTAVVSGFDGPYTMNFTVTDNGSTLNLIASVKLSGSATLTDASGNSLAQPSNNHPQIDPGIDWNGCQVWNRWTGQDGKLRELRFHSALNPTEIIAELTKLKLGWLGDLIPILGSLK